MQDYQIATDRFWLRMFYFLLSLFGAALGITFIFKAQMGVDPANVLIDGLFYTFGFSLGFWITCLWLLFIICAYVLGYKPFIATLIDLVFFGAIVDLLMWLNPAPLPHTMGKLQMPLAIFYLIIGMIILAFSVGIYINAKLGAGPTMLFTFALAHKTKKSIGLVKTILDLAMLLVGFLLGGTVGLGTIVLALGIGYLFQFFINGVKLPGLVITQAASSPQNSQ